jgi:hypothetical protein
MDINMKKHILLICIILFISLFSVSVFASNTIYISPNITITQNDNLIANCFSDNEVINTYYRWNVNNTEIYQDWKLNNNIISGLTINSGEFMDIYTYNSEIFLIKGLQSGDFVGYKWNGTGWESNSSVTEGLSDLGAFSIPNVLYINNVLSLIAHSTGILYGYSWNGTGWESNSTVINGLLNKSYFSSSDFVQDNILNLIHSDMYGGWYGYSWNGTGWESNSTIINGLSYFGTYSSIEIFQNAQDFYGFFTFIDNTEKKTQIKKWNGTTWQENNITVDFTFISVITNKIASYIDSDNNTNIITEYGTKVNGYTLNNSKFSLKLLSDNLVVGSNISLSCNFVNSTEYSGWITSDNLTLYSNILNITSINFVNINNYTNTIFQPQCIYNEYDNDNIDIYYNWYINNVKQDVNKTWVENISLKTNLNELYKHKFISINSEKYLLQKKSLLDSYGIYYYIDGSWVENVTLSNNLDNIFTNDNILEHFRNNNKDYLIDLEVLKSAYWNGTSWEEDNSVITGLNTISEYRNSLFNYDGEQYISILDSSYDHSIFKWNYKEWESVESFKTGFPEFNSDIWQVGHVIYNDENILKLIVLNTTDLETHISIDTSSYKWNGSNWEEDSSVMEGINIQHPINEYFFLKFIDIENIDGVWHNIISFGGFGEKLFYYTINTKIFDINKYERGDSLKFSCSINEKDGFITEFNSSIVSISNSPPHINSLSLSSNNIYSGDYIYGVCSAEDYDNDIILNKYYDWYINDIKQNLTYIINSSLINGLSSYGEPETFYLGHELFMIYPFTNLTNGYKWNGTGWESNSTIVNGLPTSTDEYYKVTVFDLDNNMFLIYGRKAGDWYGYKWNGNGWVSNSSIITGLNNVAFNSHPEVFMYNNELFLLTTTNEMGFSLGYKWNGTGWESNSTFTGLKLVPNTNYDIKQDINGDLIFYGVTYLQGDITSYTTVALLWNGIYWEDKTSKYFNGLTFSNFNYEGAEMFVFNGTYNIMLTKFSTYDKRGLYYDTKISPLTFSFQDELKVSCRAEDEYYLSSDFYFSNSVTILNSIPEKNTISITSSDSSQPLKLYINYTDKDNHNLTAYVSWYKNNILLYSEEVINILSGINKNILNLSTTYLDKNSFYIAEINVSDGFNYTTKSNSTTVTLSNFIPIINNFSINNKSINESTFKGKIVNLNINYTEYDDDVVSFLIYVYNQSNNLIETIETSDTNYTYNTLNLTKDIYYYFNVSAYDTYNYSINFTSINNLTINNTVSASAYLYPNETRFDLTLLDTTDIDGDIININETRWYINNIYNNTYDNQLFIPFADFDDGVEIYCNFTFNDSVETSDWTQTAIAISNDLTAPIIENMSLSSSSGNSMFVISVDTVDELGEINTILGYPKVAIYHNVNGFKSNLTMSLSENNTYTTQYSPQELSGSYTFIFYSADGNNNIAINDSNGLTYTIQTSAPSSPPVGGGGTPSPTQSYNFEILPEVMNIYTSRGLTILKEFELKNKEAKKQSFIISIEDDYGIISFADKSINTIQIDIDFDVGITSNSKFIKYDVKIPKDLSNGEYVSNIKVVSGTEVAYHKVVIVVSDNTFLNLLSYLQNPIYEKEFCVEENSQTFECIEYDTFSINYLNLLLTIVLIIFLTIFFVPLKFKGKKKK